MKVLNKDNWGQWILNDGVHLPETGLIVWAVYQAAINNKVKFNKSIVYEVGPDYIVGLIKGHGGSWYRKPGFNPIVKYRIYKSEGFKEVERLMNTTMDKPMLLLEDLREKVKLLV